MFEFPAGIRVVDDLSPEWFSVQRLEGALGSKIVRRSSTVWQEHCSECTMPSCYATCNFYRPRLDYKCRRFDSGIQVGAGIRHVAVPVRIRFGKWARLVGHGPAGLMDMKRAYRLERGALLGAKEGGGLSVLRGLSAPIRRKMINVLSGTRPWGDIDLDRLYVVIEIVSSAPTETTLLFGFRFVTDSGMMEPESFKTAIPVPPGYSVRTIPIAALIRREDLGRRFAMEIWQGEQASGHDLTFGLLEVVQLDGVPVGECGVTQSVPTPRLATSVPKLKCVVWDLDNTLWSGILVEDGTEGLRVNEEAVEIVRTLDSKGIIQSIVSKNNADDALSALKQFGLDHFFIAPQISWGPKSEALRRLQKRLNIGLDTFAFIDDQPFERAEVSAALPEVAVFDPLKLSELLADARLDLPVTTEAAERRLMYKAEDDRMEAQGAFSGTYEEFLRSCSMKVRIAKLAMEHVDRVYELAQRTNQLNVSGHRYSREEIRELLEEPGSRAAFVVGAQDKFGSYGIIGFVVIDCKERLIVDLMFSCRIQGKMVDDAFVAWLYEKTVEPGGAALHCRFKSTKKNAPARQMLERLGFERTADSGAFEVLTKASLDRTLVDLSRIISIDLSDA